MRTTHRIGAAFAAAMTLGTAACGSVPKVLYHQYPLDDRLVQYYAKPSATAPETHDFFMRVCDLSPVGELSNCVDSLILENVHPSTL